MCVGDIQYPTLSTSLNEVELYVINFYFLENSSEHFTHNLSWVTPPEHIYAFVLVTTSAFSVAIIPSLNQWVN